MSTCKVGKNCRVKGLWVGAGWGGREGFPKEGCPVGGPSENNGGSILHGPSHVAKLVHFVGPYTQV